MDIGDLFSVINAGERTTIDDQHLDATAARILDATLHDIATHGLERVTLQRVAQRAGVNRVTVYRHFGDRNHLLSTTLLREGHRFALAVATAVSGTTDPQEQIIAGFLASIRLAESHPIISRMARLEPEQLLAAGRADDGALLRFGNRFVTAVLRAAPRTDHAYVPDPERAAETLIRLFSSFVLFPPNLTVDLSDDEAAREYARTTMIPMVFTTRP